MTQAMIDDGPKAAKRSTRGRLERAAIALFAQKGIEATSTREIAGAAGVAEGSIYRHFTSKDAMARVIFEENYIELGKAMEEALANHDDMEAALAAAIGRAYRMFDDDPERFTFLILNQHRYLNGIEDARATPVGVLRRAIRSWSEPGCPDMSEVENLLAMITGLIMQPAVAMTYGALSGPLVDRTDRVAQAACAVIGTIPSATKTEIASSSNRSQG
jgi:AcrR family transcriptional regulator